MWESASSWWVVKMRMQCTCFQVCHLSQVCCFFHHVSPSPSPAPSSSVFFFFLYPFCYTSTNECNAEKDWIFDLPAPQVSILGTANQCIIQSSPSRLASSVAWSSPSSPHWTYPFKQSWSILFIPSPSPSFSFLYFVFLVFLYTYNICFSFVSFVCSPSLKDPKITRRELVSVHSNGIVLSCQGMFLGQTAGENVETSGLHCGTAVG